MVMATNDTPNTLRVSDLMTTDLVHVSPQTNVAAAEAMMALKHFRHLPVVERGHLVGLISHRDILKAQASSTLGLRPQEKARLQVKVPAAEIMAVDVATVNPGTSVADAGRRMLTSHYGCLPVVEDGGGAGKGKLVGIITEADLLRFFVNMLDHM